jgi:hypothetical protein
VSAVAPEPGAGLDARPDPYAVGTGDVATGGTAAPADTPAPVASPPQTPRLSLPASSFDEGRAAVAVLLDEVRRGLPATPFSAVGAREGEVVGSLLLTLEAEHARRLATRLGQDLPSAPATHPLRVRVEIVRPPGAR